MTIGSVLMMMFVAVVFLCVGLAVGWLIFGGPGSLGRMMLSHVKAEMSEQAATVIRAKAKSFVSAPAQEPPADAGT